MMERLVKEYRAALEFRDERAEESKGREGGNGGRSGKGRKEGEEGQGDSLSFGPLAALGVTAFLLLLRTSRFSPLTSHSYTSAPSTPRTSPPPCPGSPERIASVAQCFR